jgi:hypothetical protein
MGKRFGPYLKKNFGPCQKKKKKLTPYLKKIWGLIKRKFWPYHLGALGNCLGCLALEPGLLLSLIGKNSGVNSVHLKAHMAK